MNQTTQPSALTKAKCEACQQLLDANRSVFVRLHPRAEGVAVPPWLTHQDCLTLQIGYQMAVPIPDLILSSVCWTGTLSFSRTPYLCVVPWTAVYEMVGESKGLFMGPAEDGWRVPYVKGVEPWTFSGKPATTWHAPLKQPAREFSGKRPWTPRVIQGGKK